MEAITVWALGLLVIVGVVSATWMIIKITRVVFFHAMRRLSVYNKRFMAFVRI